MTALSPDELNALLTRGCGCGRNHLRARAIASGKVTWLDGEPASPISFTYEPEHLHERVYRVECAECGDVKWQREDCPRCGLRGGLAKALDGRNGITPPNLCQHCDGEELTLDAELRMHVMFVNGRRSRRVADAEPHEPGFHVIEVTCAECDQHVAQAGEAKCPVCGKSSLLKKIR